MNRVSRETGVQLAWRWAAVGLVVWCVARLVVAAFAAWPGLVPLAVAAAVVADRVTRPAAAGGVQVSREGAVSR